MFASLLHVSPTMIAMMKVDVLGVLRCDWAEVASLIGVAVTPVVGFLGNLSREQINPNPDEVGLLAVHTAGAMRASYRISWLISSLYDLTC